MILSSFAAVIVFHWKFAANYAAYGRRARSFDSAQGASLRMTALVRNLLMSGY